MGASAAMDGGRGGVGAGPVSASLRALRALPPAAAWRASAGALRRVWLRHTHTAATQAAGAAPTLAAWAALAGCGVSTLTAARRGDAAAARLAVASVGRPRRIA